MKKFLYVLCLSIAFSATAAPTDWPTYKKIDDRVLIYRTAPDPGLWVVALFMGGISSIAGAIAHLSPNMPREGQVLLYCYSGFCGLITVPVVLSIMRTKHKKFVPILILDKKGFLLEGYEPIEWKIVDGVLFKTDNLWGKPIGIIYIETHNGTIELNPQTIAINPDRLKLFFEEYGVKIYPRF